MRIARIKLDNYRCHGHFEESFPLGINLLLGKNGSGKSSVLEAIGMIVCGDTGRGASESGAVGPLKKHANIEIEFIDRDNVRWLAKKRIGAGGHAVRVWRWQGSGWQLEKSGILPGLLGLSKKDAKTVYQTMIVAEQNQFTLPFLATSTNRRTIFDSVFGISQWHELGTKSGLETPYSQRVSALKARLETLEEQLAASERSELEAEEAALEQRIIHHESEIRLLDTARQNAFSLASAFRRVDESQQEAKRMQERLSELSQRVEAFKQDLAWLEKNAPSLERFEILEHQLELLRACHEAALGVEAARAREETSEARLVEVRAECTRLSERLEQSTKALQRERAELDESLPLVKALEQAGKQLEDRLAALTAARAALTVLGERGAGLDKLRQKRDRLVQDVERWQNLQAQKETLLGEKGDAAARQRALSQQGKSLESGICPFFGEACQNLAGRTQAPQDEIGQLVQSLTEITRQTAERLNQINEELSGLEGAGSELGAVEQAIQDSEEREGARQAALEKEEQALREYAAAEAAFDRALQPILDLPETAPLSQVLQPVQAKERQAQLEAVRRALQTGQATSSAEEKKLTLLREDEARLLQLLEKTASEALQAQDEADQARNRYALTRASALAALPELPAEADSIAISGIEKRLLAARPPLVILAEEAAVRRGRLAERETLERQQLAARSACETADKDSEQARAALDEARVVLQDSLTGLRLDALLTKPPHSEDEAQLLRDGLDERIVANSQSLGEARAARDNLAKKKAEQERLVEASTACRKDLAEAQRRLSLVKGLRTLLKGLGPWIARYALPLVARQATLHFRRITGRSERIFWTHSETASYCITLAESEDDGGARSFEHLSGGEQVAVALSLRAALVESLSSSGFVIFDEPTINLDSAARASLASSFRTIFGRIEQAFVITHDDSFEAMADNELHFG